jgi:hypothetical protein
MTLFLEDRTRLVRLLGLLSSKSEGERATVWRVVKKRPLDELRRGTRTKDRGENSNDDLCCRALHRKRR